jgi:hypothetical protein
MDHQKIQAVEDWPQPRTVHAVRGFLGLAGYYRNLSSTMVLLLPHSRGC